MVPPDTPLSEHGELQAEELGFHVAELEPKISVVYTSPFYRCIQTIEPAVRQVRARNDHLVEIRGEPGFGEWYGTGRSNDPAPASAQVLQQFFPTYSTDYQAIWTPVASGESIDELYNRCAYVLAYMIQELDSDPLGHKSVLICTHAAIIPIIGRILTGNKPKSATEEDFIPWTASLFTFRRWHTKALDNISDANQHQALPKLIWENGIGVGGLWECLTNGDCSFLSHGKERGWRFSGKESFDHAVIVHGLDAGTGLGVIIESDNPSGEP